MMTLTHYYSFIIVCPPAIICFASLHCTALPPGRPEFSDVRSPEMPVRARRVYFLTGQWKEVVYLCCYIGVKIDGYMESLTRKNRGEAIDVN